MPSPCGLRRSLGEGWAMPHIFVIRSLPRLSFPHTRSPSSRLEAAQRRIARASRSFRPGRVAAKPEPLHPRVCTRGSVAHAGCERHASRPHLATGRPTSSLLRGVDRRRPRSCDRELGAPRTSLGAVEPRAGREHSSRGGATASGARENPGSLAPGHPVSPHRSPEPVGNWREFERWAGDHRERQRATPCDVAREPRTSPREG